MHDERMCMSLCCLFIHGSPFGLFFITIERYVALIADFIERVDDLLLLLRSDWPFAVSQGIVWVLTEGAAQRDAEMGVDVAWHLVAKMHEAIRYLGELLFDVMGTCVVARC